MFLFSLFPKEKEFSETKTKLEEKEKEFSTLSNDFEAFKTDALVKFSRLNQLEKEEMERNEKLFSDNTEALIKEFSDLMKNEPDLDTFIFVKLIKLLKINLLDLLE